MCVYRQETLRLKRLGQPLRELQRKAQKSVRARLWTQEQFDYLDAVSLRLHGKLNLRHATHLIERPISAN